MTAQEDLAVLRHPVGCWNWEPDMTAPYGEAGKKTEVLYRCLRDALPCCDVTIAWAPIGSGELEYTITAELQAGGSSLRPTGQYRVPDYLLCRWERPVSRLAYILAHLLAQALVKDTGR